MGMIDAQYKDQVYRDTLKENERLKKEIKMLEKLIELNMKDLWDIADQRDWYYEEYRKLKDKLS
jgi:archaellum component FlaC